MLLRKLLARLSRKGFTLLEILVVVVIISLLSSIAVGVYVKEIQRARYARARAEVASLEIGINAYYLDLGSFPASLSGDGTPDGSGFLQMQLRSSSSGDMYAPSSPRWSGPYVDWDYNWIGSVSGNTDLSGLNKDEIHFLDPWGNPYIFLQNRDYNSRGGTRLDNSDPYFSSETWYNPITFQIISKGANETTFTAPNRGLEPDDVTNFRGSQY